MDWVIFSLISAFFAATYYMLLKKSTKKFEPFRLFARVFLIAGVISLAISFVNGFPKIGEEFYLALGITVVLNVFATSLYFKALKTTDLSIAVPLLSFTPVFLILTSFLILGEIPTWIGVVGIFVIFIGSYVLNSGKRESFWTPVKSIFRHKGTLYMLGVAFIYSITANYSKVLLINSDFVFGSAVMFLASGIIFLVLSFSKPKERIHLERSDIFMMVLMGVSLSAAFIAMNFAFLSQIVPYVISVRRLSIIFSVFYGEFMFKEKNIVRRIIGAAIMVLGVVLIVLP